MLPTTEQIEEALRQSPIPDPYYKECLEIIKVRIATKNCTLTEAITFVLKWVELIDEDKSDISIE
jgi:hypothetical protein